MKKLKIFFLALLTTYTVFAQDKTNSLYIEAGGNTIYYSINYDRIIPISQTLKLAPRLGFMYLPMSKIYNTSTFGNIRVPIEANLLWSRTPTAKNFLEGGLGLSLIQLKERVTYSFTGNDDIEEDISNRFSKVTTLRLGFRHQKPTGGLMYRAGILIPIIRDEYSQFRMGDDIFYTVWAGFSLGYSF